MCSLPFESRARRLVLEGNTWTGLELPSGPQPAVTEADPDVAPASVVCPALLLQETLALSAEEKAAQSHRVGRVLQGNGQVPR